MKKILVGGTLVGLVVLGVMVTRTTTPDPDEQLVSRFDDLCKIARDNVQSPNQGVTELGTYMSKHAGDMYKHVIDTVVLVSQIKDDDALDARGKLARTRWSESLESCAEHWMDFADAVEGDPEASRRISEYNERLERAVDVIFGDSALRDLPREMGRFLGAKLDRARLLHAE